MITDIVRITPTNHYQVVNTNYNIQGGEIADNVPGDNNTGNEVFNKDLAKVDLEKNKAALEAARDVVLSDMTANRYAIFGYAGEKSLVKTKQNPNCLKILARATAWWWRRRRRGAWRSSWLSSTVGGTSTA